MFYIRCLRTEHIYLPTYSKSRLVTYIIIDLGLD